VIVCRTSYSRWDGGAPVCCSVTEEIMISISEAMVRYGFL
jgi:hypothetical protein